MDAINTSKGPFYVNQSLQINFDTNEDLTGAQVFAKAIPPGKTEIKINGGRAKLKQFILNFTPTIVGNWKFWLYGLTKDGKTIISSPVDINIRKEGT